MPNNFLLVAHGVQMEIDTTPNESTRTWVTFGEGVENITEALTETVQQYFFFANKGYASNYVTGMAPSYTCTGRRITCGVTIANVTDMGGATTDGSTVSFEVRFNGKPTLATITPPSTLEVQSVAGTNTGDTKITVTPTDPVAGCKYIYDYGEEAPTATVGQVITGWNDFVNGQDYTIPSGYYVVVAMVNTSTSVVVATGQATVVSKTE